MLRFPWASRQLQKVYSCIVVGRITPGIGLLDEESYSKSQNLTWDRKEQLSWQVLMAVMSAPHCMT